MGKINLLKETQEQLKEEGKTLEDIIWCGTRENQIHKDQLISLLNVTYDDGFGGQEVAPNLIIVGKNWWMERHEYDGSEWWEFKTLPIKPKTIMTVNNLITGSWEDL